MLKINGLYNFTTTALQVRLLCATTCIKRLIVRCTYAKMGTPTEVPFLGKPDPSRTIAGLCSNETNRFPTERASQWL